MSVSVFSDWKYSVAEQFQKYLHIKGEVKTFIYVVCNFGQSFVLDPTPDPTVCYMTSQQANVKTGDRVQIYYPDEMTSYWIQEIEYYAEPSDMWVAKLLKIEAE